ncbi:MAG: RNA methyltransferase [Bacteroidota bacterium]|nr:RNA methyltransferase [Bacteroidota bacterium]
MQNTKTSSSQLNRPSLEAFKLAEKTGVHIILNNIRSAQNIGSIFRTADAFNVKKIFITGISAIPPHKEILKTALGATESVVWEYHENAVLLIQTLKSKGEKIYAIEQTSNSILLQDFTYNSESIITIIMGNEVDGVDQNLIDLCDGSIEIPQFGTKHSLNVAVSTGIVLWHFMNQILQKNENLK